METLSETQDDSSGANPSSVKSEDGSPRADGERSSPPPNCAICLGRCRNKSFTDSCLHQFCFKCLVTWSKVKTECPLCKQNFKSIIHNVRSNQQYEEYRVEQRRHEEDRIDIDDLVTATRRFRYRTTLTFPRGREHLALQQLLMHYPPLSAMVNDLPGVPPAPLPSSRRRRSPSSFRRTVYRHNLWARPLPDFTGRFRDCTPEFYRYNDSQMHRLVPWLNRELHYLLNENAGHIAYVIARILELLPQYHVTSPEFREEMYRYFGSRTDHFLHELQCYASTPYDLTGYDRNVQYTTDSRLHNTVNDVISSSDTESGDSDIVLVSTPPYNHPVQVIPSVYPHRVDPGQAAGPSIRRPPDPVYPQSHIAPQSGAVIPIETISNSDTDDDEVMVTGYIKPPHQRTPEVVDLIASDSDVVVQDDPPPEPAREGRGMVKLSLSKPRVASVSGSESDDASYTPPLPPPTQRSRKRRSRESDSEYRISDVSDSWSSSLSESRSGSSRTPRRHASDSDNETASNSVRSHGAYHLGRNARRKKNKRKREAVRAATARHEREALARREIEAISNRHGREATATQEIEAAGSRNEREATTSRHGREAATTHDREAAAIKKRETTVTRRSRESTSTADDIQLSMAKYDRESPTYREVAAASTSTARHASSRHERETATSRHGREVATARNEFEAAVSRHEREIATSRHGRETAMPRNEREAMGTRRAKESTTTADNRSVSNAKYDWDSTHRADQDVAMASKQTFDNPSLRHRSPTPDKDRREKDKRSKRKSRNGKGVKSSKKSAESTVGAPETTTQPGPSGLAENPRKKDRDDNTVPSSSVLKRKHSEDNPGPSGASKRRNIEDNPTASGFGLPNGLNKHTEDHSRSHKRLKSVVKKASGFSAVPESSKQSKCNSSDAPNVVVQNSSNSFSDSDDDIPLNLTIQRST